LPHPTDGDFTNRGKREPRDPPRAGPLVQLGDLSGIEVPRLAGRIEAQVLHSHHLRSRGELRDLKEGTYKK